MTLLLDYQQRGVEKLSKVKVGAFYAEQGLGKTRMTLDLCKTRLDNGKVEHILWLCPCSAKENLRRDIIKHTGSSCENEITIMGIETLSSSIKANIELISLVESMNVYLVVDESNLVKNHRAKRTERIINLSSKCTYKLILNGTPIARNEADLFAQWYILDWRILGYKSFWSFAANHLEYDENVRGKIRRCLNTDYLAEKIALYTYQVTKEECLNLPDKRYEIEYYELTPEQDKHYEQIADELLFKVDELKPHTIYRMFTGLQNVISGYEVDTKEEGLVKKDFFESPLENPRIKKLLEVIESYLENDEKCIIFCKYTDEINNIVNILQAYGGAVAFNGEVNQKNRQNNLTIFMEDIRFLVANKQCGAYGLNLQFCKNIIYYSNDWDYATRAQSEDRVHRLGQNKEVKIIDICAEYTLDKRIIKCLRKKENLLESFREEISKNNDKDYLIDWISKRDLKGRNYTKKIKSLDREDLFDANI